MRPMKSLLPLALAACLPLASAPARADGPVTIRAAWINTPASLIAILFPKPGIARHNGVTYNFQPVYFANSPTQITAVAAGELEITTLNFTSIPLAILNAGLTDLRIIADETEEGFADYATIHYAVLKDGPIKTVADLKGKMLAVIGIGAGTDIGMRAYLIPHGLNYPGDYNLVEARPPVMLSMLEDHKVDLIGAAVPFTTTPEFAANARTLFTMKQSMHGSELSVWLARKDFIAQHRPALVDLLEDMVRSYRWYADPANHTEAVAILSRAVKQPPEQLQWAFTKNDYYRDPNGIPNLDMLQRNIDTVKALGFIKSDVDVKRFADLSLVKEADARE
jgi:sulfonate transport system substrate-binding protein